MLHVLQILKVGHVNITKLKSKRSTLSISCPTETEKKALKKELKKLAAYDDTTIFKTLKNIVSFYKKKN